jgi:hypothetical protein
MSALKTLAVGLSLCLAECCLAADTPSPEAEESPRVVVERWHSYFAEDKVEKYVDEALIASEIRKVGSTPAQMTERCKANKEFFVAILEAMKEPKTVSILDDGTNKIAVFYFKENTRGYHAASLKWLEGRWVVGTMYRPGEPVSTIGP